MKVILGCDPLLQQLTGIGQYTKHIANQLISRKNIDEFKFFAHGKFFSKDILNESASINVNKLTLAQKLRSLAASSIITVKIYQFCLPYITQFTLRKYKDYVFHSPNFIMPKFKGKKIVTIHDLSTLRFPQYHPNARVDFVNQAINQAVKYADHIITDSEFIKQEIITLLDGDEKKITAIPLAADDTFHPRTSLQCAEFLNSIEVNYKQFFLFVSTVEPRKNLLNLLEAFCLYRQKYSEGLPLVIAGGNGWRNHKTVCKIKELECKGWVKYLGYADQKNIPILYSSAKALLFPSFYEGFGLPVLEAMQSGLPVLTSKNSSMSEITGESAILVDPNDIKEMSALINELSNDNDLCAVLSKDGLTRSRDYSWNKCTEETIALYKMYQ